MTRSFTKPTVSVIIPVHNGGESFQKCLSSVADSKPPPYEVIVVADGDSDGSWRQAEELGMQVLRIPVPEGPARARNMGAHTAKGDILFFTDADVTIPPDTIDRVATAFQNTPDMDALFGSYDDKPYETNFLSQYKNLLHHYVHQISNEEASTFWGACGAIRRDIFLKLGGFDEAYYRKSGGGRPGTCEDIELGYRIRMAGHRICLFKDIQVKHLKRWEIGSLLKADFFYRALPWTDMILSEGRFFNDLNINVSSRVSVASVFILVSSLLGSLWVPWLSVPAFISATLLLWLNQDVYRFFKNKRGLWFAIKTIPWHWFYFFYSGVAFSVGYAKHKIKKFRTPS